VRLQVFHLSVMPTFSPVWYDRYINHYTIVNHYVMVALKNKSVLGLYNLNPCQEVTVLGNRMYKVFVLIILFNRFST